MFFEIRKFPIFRKVDVFFDKNDNFSKNSGHACLIPLSLAFAQKFKNGSNQRMKVDRFE